MHVIVYEVDFIQLFCQYLC